ncbi:MAG: hypothetical protein GXP38_15110 [Chloroflexi bacterium]|nr:hypothetical protein [Chloroflexota bacterium]
MISPIFPGSRCSSPAKILLFLFLTTSVLGVYFLPIRVAGVTLFGFRLLVIGTLLLFFLFPDFTWWSIGVARFYIILGLVWLTWGSISYFWAPDASAAIKEILAVGFGFSIGFIFLGLRAYSEEGMTVLGWGWSSAYLLTLFVAGWELVTGRHLPSYYLSHLPSYAVPRITGTLGQPNNLGAFLVLVYPFLWLSYRRTERPLLRWMQLALIVTVPVLLVFTASRLAMLAFFLQMAILGFFAVLPPRRHLSVLAVVVVSVGILLTGLLNPSTDINRKLDAASYELHRMEAGKETVIPGEDESRENIGESRPERILSIQQRINLLLNGLWLTKVTFGRGVGPGGFAYYQTNKITPYPVINPDPHNFWIEVLSQYGILVFVLFLAWYLSLYRVVLKYRHSGLAIILLMALVGYIFASAANSSYIAQQTNWIFLASIMSLASYLVSRKPAENDQA